MAAGLTDRVYDMRWLSDLVSGQMPNPGKRGSYKPRSKA